ncbi:MAG: DUF3307 domain-containing protein [Chlamydiales bacterium]
MIWTLLVIMQIKHFVADYPLQTPYMLGKFKDKNWIRPLAAHCGIHFLFTFFISCTFLFYTNGGLVWSILFGGIDFLIHFIMDRIKASPKMLGRYESLSKIQFKGLMESKQLALGGVNYVKRPELIDESKRIVADIDRQFQSNTYFWWALGFDQMVHHLTDILIIYLILVDK